MRAFLYSFENNKLIYHRDLKKGKQILQGYFQLFYIQMNMYVISKV